MDLQKRQEYWKNHSREVHLSLHALPWHMLYKEGGGGGARATIPSSRVTRNKNRGGRVGPYGAHACAIYH